MYCLWLPSMRGGMVNVSTYLSLSVSLRSYLIYVSKLFYNWSDTFLSFDDRRKEGSVFWKESWWSTTPPKSTIISHPNSLKIKGPRYIVTMCKNPYRWIWTCLVRELMTMSNGQYSDIDSIPFSLRTPGSLYQSR